MISFSYFYTIGGLILMIPAPQHRINQEIWLQQIHFTIKMASVSEKSITFADGIAIVQIPI